MHVKPAAPAASRRTTLLQEHPAGRLPFAIQDPAAVGLAGGGIALLAGLSAADVSLDEAVIVRRGRSRSFGRLPHALHDAAGVRLGGTVYVFGGGDAVGQLSAITSVDLATGSARAAGTLPAASSDSAATAVAGTAYVVGGYTGTSWLDTIVAWRPGARRTCRRPPPVRGALRGRHDGRAHRRDRRRLARKRLGQHGGAHVRSPHPQDPARGKASTADDARGRSGDRADRLRDRRPWRDDRHADGANRLDRPGNGTHPACRSAGDAALGPRRRERRDAILVAGGKAAHGNARRSSRSLAGRGSLEGAAAPRARTRGARRLRARPAPAC